MNYSPLQVIIIFAMRLVEVYSYLILIRVIMSWVVSDPYNKIYAFLVSITEPLLGPIRKIMPQIGLDFSPIIAFFLLKMLSGILFGFL